MRHRLLSADKRCRQFIKTGADHGNMNFLASLQGGDEFFMSPQSTLFVGSSIELIGRLLNSDQRDGMPDGRHTRDAYG